MPFVSAALVGSAGAARIFFWTSSMMVASLTVMCSAASATDQTSGAGLKVHWAAERPWMEARKAARVSLRWRIAFSRSADVIGPAVAQTSAKRDRLRSFFMVLPKTRLLYHV